MAGSSRQTTRLALRMPAPGASWAVPDERPFRRNRDDLLRPAGGSRSRLTGCARGSPPAGFASWTGTLRLGRTSAADRRGARSTPREQREPARSGMTHRSRQRRATANQTAGQESTWIPLRQQTVGTDPRHRNRDRARPCHGLGHTSRPDTGSAFGCTAAYWRAEVANLSDVDMIRFWTSLSMAAPSIQQQASMAIPPDGRSAGRELPSPERDWTDLP